MVFVRWSDKALGNVGELEPIVRERVFAKVSWLEGNFSDVVPDRLHHELRDLYKLRIGDYRAIYSIRGDVITIEAVGHRRDIYR